MIPNPDRHITGNYGEDYYIPYDEYEEEDFEIEEDEEC